MRILERNFRRGRNGEIDIIGRDGKYLVFVEVKYRRDGQTGDPLEAVDRAKQRRISRTAQCYCLTHGGRDNGETEDHLQSCGLLPLSASLWGGYLGAL